MDGEVLERHVDLSLLPTQLVALFRHEGRHDARREVVWDASQHARKRRAINKGQVERTIKKERDRKESSDQVIRENPANRGTETSAEFLVGPPWRMESNGFLLTSSHVIRGKDTSFFSSK